MIRKLFSMTAITTLALTFAQSTLASNHCSINVVTSNSTVGAIFNAETSDGSYGTDAVVYYDVYRLQVPCNRAYKISATPMSEKMNSSAHGKYKYKEEVYLNKGSSVSVVYPGDFPDAPK